MSFSEVCCYFFQPVADRDLLRAFLLTFATLLALGCKSRFSRQHVAKGDIVIDFGYLRGVKHTGGIVHLKAFGNADAGWTRHVLAACALNLDPLLVFCLNLHKEASSS